MRIARARLDGSERWGRMVDERTLRPWTAAPWDGGREREADEPLGELLAPVRPSKIVCVGRNYRAHAEELGNEVPSLPLLFLKPPSALLAPGGTIGWPADSERVDFEGEIAVVIGLRLSKARPEEAEAAIFGLTCANDVTARDLQRADVQFTRGKGFDTFCPCGPWIETEPPGCSELQLTTRVDGEPRQRGRSDQMIWPIPDLLAFISGVMTLEPGDLVLTGTPEGVGPLRAGQRVEVELEGVGVLGSVLGPRPGGGEPARP